MRGLIGSIFCAFKKYLSGKDPCIYIIYDRYFNMLSWLTCSELVTIIMLLISYLFDLMVIEFK